jgi:DNA phosphorothioation-dependent restriction protein DptH
MSEKQFENFLAETLIKWGQDNLQEGYRYQFQSPDSDNSQKLYNALNELSTSFVTVKGVNIPVITTGAKSILVVLHNEDNSKGFSENFISYIRDVVAAQQGEIKSCALLVIHNSLLDTLINSAENIAQSGWVWHPNEIMEALKTLIDPFDPSEKVSKCLLKHRFEQIIEDGATMFGFEELFNAMVDDGDLKLD